ncbi:MAG: class B sortase [Clostridia bacterium]|nr:class B sortase [Clostridia bacterium]
MGKYEKKKSKKNIMANILLIIFVSLLIISSIEIIKWYKENRENKKVQEKISEAIIIDKEKTTIDFEKLKEINKDAVGWIKVNGTDIEYAVVKTNNNSYYLDHNFENEYNKAGWIFADYKNKLDGTDNNIVIYGHNRKDGSMFSSLKNILKEEWYSNEENRKITFITEKEESVYEVFSIYQIEAEDYYITTDFKNGEFLEYIKIVKDRSIKDFNIEVSKEDNILTLSTCGNDNDYRVVVHAKRVK